MHNHLSSGSTEIDLRRAVQPPSPVLWDVQCEATALHRKALALRWAPEFALGEKWKKLGFESSSNERQGRAYEALRIALEAREHYSAFIARFSALKDHERQDECLRDKDDYSRAEYGRLQSIAMSIPAPRWSATEHLAKLAQRGITLSMRDGKLMATGDGLSAADHAVLTARKAELVEFLSSAVEIA